MKTRDLLSKLNDEVASVMPKSMPDAITDTPINVKANREATATHSRAKTSFVKTRAFKAMCACLVCVAVLTGVLVPVLLHNGDKPAGIIDGATYISLDINPSVDYVVDNGNIVKNVLSRNSDADVLLSNGFRESLIGKSIDDAIDMTLEKSVQLGYINATADRTGAGGINAARISVASDNSAKATSVIDLVKTSATNYLKTNGIYMVIVGKEVDKSVVLGSSGIESIDEWNEVSETREGFYYKSNVLGKTSEEIQEVFKNEVISEYVADAFDDLFEDIDDIMDLIHDMDELFDELDALETEEGGLIKRGYWYYRNLVEAGNTDSITLDVLETVNDITEKVDEYNEIIRDEDNDAIIDLSHILSPLTVKNQSYYWHKLKAFEKFYRDGNIKEDAKDLIDKVDDNIDNLDALLRRMNGLFELVFDDFSKVTDAIKTNVDREIASIEAEANYYYELCAGNIDKTYNKLLERNENNRASGAISDEDYESYLEDILEGFADDDDFWEQIHSNK